MKSCRALAPISNALGCLSASAQQFQPFKPFQPLSGFNPPTRTTYNQIGNTSYGSNGSSSYQSGETSIHSDGSSADRTGNRTTHSDDTRTQRIGDAVYGQKPDGSQFYCRGSGQSYGLQAEVISLETVRLALPSSL